MMKHSAATASAALLIAFLPVSSAQAEGYQVNTLSAKQIGMAHSGIAMKLGAESMYFNPAGLAFTDRTLDLSASFSAIMQRGPAPTTPRNTQPTTTPAPR